MCERQPRCFGSNGAHFSGGERCEAVCDRTPNTSVPLAGGATLTLNEQSTTSNSITVNGVHVTGPGGVDIIVASAYSDINCSAPPS
ncbi:MAG: choice-of-anchor P family protein [Gemmatimonadaceae bacterium]